MPRFRVLIAPGIAHVVDAATEEEARKKTQAEIATGAVSPFYDQLYFDYETGVNVKKLRQKLGRAETEKEENVVLNNLIDRLEGNTPTDQENILVNEVGPAGFIRNTKGQVALTPYGMELLNLKPSTKTLSDGTTIQQNTIIDENSFNLRTGDLSDLSGIAGPIIGTVVGLLPQVRLVKILSNMLGKREALARTFIAGAGSAAGKAGEEALDTREGFQLQDRDELADLYKEEFVIGSVGQGVFGEIPSKLYQTFLGARAPIESKRILRQMGKGRTWDDVRKLDESLGRPATEREIKKAIRDGRVRLYNWEYGKGKKIAGAIPAQATLGKELMGRYQKIVEQIIGNNRDKINAAALRNELDNILSLIKTEKTALNEYLNVSTKEGLDETINKTLQNLRLQEKTVTGELEKLLEKMGTDFFNLDNAAGIPNREIFGAELKATLGKLRKTVQTEMGDTYAAVDLKFVDLASPYRMVVNPKGRNIDFELDADGNLILKSQQEVNESIAFNKAINLVVRKHVDQSLRLIQQYKASSNFWKAGAKNDEIKKGTILDTEEILKSMRQKADDVLEGKNLDANGIPIIDEATGLPKLGINLRQIRNDISDIRDITTETLHTSREREVLTNVLRTLDDTVYDASGNSAKNSDSIFSELEVHGFKNIQRQLQDEFGTRLTPDMTVKIKRALDDLRDANRTNYERMKPFDSMMMDRLISSAKKGAIQADRVYADAVLNGSPADLKNIFKALRDYDEYLARTGQEVVGVDGKVLTSEEKLKKQLRQRLFNDAFQGATEEGLTEINFTQFARHMQKFERENLGKIDELFRNRETGQSSGQFVRDTINQLLKLNPRLRPQDIKNLVNDMEGPKAALRGINSEQAGRNFIAKLKELAEASANTAKFESDRAIALLPERTISESVKAIFRPGNSSTIEKLKVTLKDSPEVFNEIQQVSMGQLLRKSIDFNGEGKITDLFKHQNLQNALDSYGNETLDAMFGVELRKGLREFSNTIDVFTKGEIGRGGSAGGLVAAGLSAAIIFQPLASIPLLTAVGIARVLFSNRRFVASMAKTDPGSIKQSFSIFLNTLRQSGLRYVNGEIVPFAEMTVENVLGSAQDQIQTEAGVTDEDVGTGIEQGKQFFQDLKNNVLREINTTGSLPDVEPTVASVDPLSPERIDFAERVAGRPIV